MAEEEIEIETYCGHCEQDTPHRIIPDSHERDSSNEYGQCLVCGWYYIGWNDKYYSPYSD